MTVGDQILVKRVENLNVTPGAQPSILLDPVVITLPRVNFTNIPQAAFTHADPKSAKKTVKFSSF